MRKAGFICLVLTALWGCQKDPQKYVNNNISNIFSVSAPPDSITADGKSTLTITAQLNSLTNTADVKTVSFSTSVGVFADNGLASYATDAGLVGGKLLAAAYLRPTQDVTDRVIVKVSIAGLDTSLIIRYVTARPDSIHSESTVAIIKRSYAGEVPVTTYLVRKIGLPSLHQTVSYNAIKADGTPIGSFRGISPTGNDVTGLVNAVLVLRDSVYTGNIRIISTVAGTQKKLADTVKVYVKP
ncbi:MAG: hypothetical protein JWQ79_3179 [Mucilaginibacter sp.]|nr:hypothetical protein [Mucilaginibacter sp.]